MNAPSQSIAIVGMSCIFPGAANLAQYWHNIINAVDAVREPAEQEWDARFYKNKTAGKFGKIYCSRAGFITENAEFDPLEFGIMPASLAGGDPDQFLALRVAAEALRDAGYQHKTCNADRAEIIIGRTMAPGVGSLNLIQHGQTIDQLMEVLKVTAPDLKQEQLNEIAERLHKGLQPCNADTIPAVMPNVLSGRIASKLGFRGRNLILDAACASSLIAVETAMQGLLSGQSDLAIAGGVHINSSPYFFQMFCELGAVSASGEIRPFDENADGTILGEGVGMVVLKRLEDAIKDKNRVYAVLRGIGSSSDGRGGTSLAPNVEGEALSMRRAYDMAGFSADSVELYEAHGTGTRAGDKAEMKAVQDVFGSGKDKTRTAWCALGSVKSQIGHTQAASGIAGLIKTALALHYKVLPPTLHFSKANTQIDWAASPCYVNTQARNWEAKTGKQFQPRRAAVSAFGFGGVNAHAVLEEFDQAKPAEQLDPNKKERKSPSTVKLLLKYPALSANSLAGMDLVANKEPVPDRVAPAARPTEPARIAAPVATASAGLQQMARVQNAEVPIGEEELILQAYLQTLGAFQKNLLGVQENIMLNYLEDDN